MEDRSPSPDRIRRYVRTEYADVLGTIDACADAVSSDCGEPLGRKRTAIVEPFRSALEDSDVLAELPAVLADVVDEIDHDLPAPPAPAPPYVVVTSTGVLLRATLPPGRLVIAIEPFAVSRDDTPTYRRRPTLGVDVRLE